MEEEKKKAESLREKGIIPTLGIVRVGSHPEDLSYEKGIEKKAEKIGALVKKFVFPESVQEEELVSEIKRLNEEKEIQGVLIFRPLPKHIRDDEVRRALLPEKDLDGITDLSQAGVFTGSKVGFPPCTAEAVMELLSFYEIDPAGKNVTVIGRSQVIGKPVALLLLQKNATVTICHTKTRNLPELLRNAEILISAAGHIHTVTKECVCEGQILIDVAVNFDEQGKMCGDVDFEDADKKAAAITPVPGGVGGITSSVLMRHLIRACEDQLHEQGKIH